MISTYLISKAVKKHCKVVLGGDGGDELFGGYSQYSRYSLIKLFYVPGFIKRIIDYYPDIKYLEMGSLGLKSILVGSGFCDLFIKTTKFRDWDVIHAKLMLNESNFKMLSLDGTTFDFGVQHDDDKGWYV